MAQSQYATVLDLSTIAITRANAERYGIASCEAMLKAASSIADSYIVSQFELPLVVPNPDALPPVPQGWDMSLTIAVCNIAAYLLACQFGFNPNAPADKLYEERYTRALSWLGQIRDKELFPQWTDSSASGGPTPVQAGPYIDSDYQVGFTCQSVPPANQPPGCGTNWAGSCYWNWW